jgi:hypothetical protein
MLGDTRKMFPAGVRNVIPAPSRIVEVKPSQSISRLDRVLNDLIRDHALHTDGPVFPCLLCLQRRSGSPAESFLPGGRAAATV